MISDKYTKSFVKLVSQRLEPNLFN